MNGFSGKTIVYLIPLLFVFYPAIAKETVIPGKVIKGNEYWSGKVILTGDVVIASSGKLVIHPGTQVLFQPKTDRTRSGRDKTRSEIIVRGILMARGTVDNKIVFSSSSPQPRMQDWYGITISNPRRPSTIEYAVIQYAYNGIVIKKSKPVIKNCQIQFNYNAGIIAEVGAAPKISGNIISDNGYAGVICNTGARPVLSDNMITKNDIGIIVLGTARPNLGNTQAGKDRNIGRNGIFDNQKYNVYNHSSSTVKAENNSWGTKDAREIMVLIYDAEDDKKYGQVDISPVLGGAINLEQKIILAQNNQTQTQAPAAGTTETPPAQESGTPQETTGQTEPAQPQDALAVKRSLPADSLQATQPEGTIAQETTDTIAILNQKSDTIQITPPLAVKTSQQEESGEKTKQAPEASIDYNQIFLDVFLDKGREIIKKVRPVISNPERGLRAHGRVIIRVVVGKNGFVESAKVLRGLNPYYDDLALRAAQKFTFRPGTVKGTPVRFSTSILFEF